ncbi:putative multiple sugar transport system permease protein [Spinactinospora alkalitolerans]|uniref:Xylose transport system permease protein XylH n=1 Tax=Spinactinospora alkalitolerans TaxID=687207 RepID=A0A852TYF7_9ACTN|nr:multiple monosaccharide ABC transporter permease [Spinactinospora alkalitolerans]NYE49029.1 putative multiple sugar transport system permease protein [Spinactinospora alkalitolerans]
MTAIRDLFRKNARQYGMLMALVLIVVLFEFLTGGLLLQPLNITNLIMQNSYILILAIGMMLVIITGHIDLSVGSVVAFVGAASAVMMAQWGLPVWLTVVAALAMGALIGAWQGFWVAYVRIPAFIVTLAGMLLFRGLTLIVLDGQTIAPLPASFRVLGSGYVPDPFGAGVHVLTLLIGVAASALLVWTQLQARARSRRHGLPVSPQNAFAARIAALVIVINVFAYVLAIHNGIPVVGLVLVVLIVGFSFVMNKTITGRHVYAVGGSEKAALLSGVRTKQTTFWVFVTMGVLSALAGLVFMARLNAATPGAGEMFELDAIAAAFIGGASATGGVGTVVGSVVGALVMGVMNNGMSLIGLGVDWQQAIKGLVLLAAVAFDVYNKDHLGLRRARRGGAGRSTAAPRQPDPDGAATESAAPPAPEDARR